MGKPSKELQPLYDRIEALETQLNELQSSKKGKAPVKPVSVRPTATSSTGPRPGGGSVSSATVSN